MRVYVWYSGSNPQISPTLPFLFCSSTLWIIRLQHPVSEQQRGNHKSALNRKLQSRTRYFCMHTQTRRSRRRWKSCWGLLQMCRYRDLSNLSHEQIPSVQIAEWHEWKRNTWLIGSKRLCSNHVCTCEDLIRYFFFIKWNIQKRYWEIGIRGSYDVIEYVAVDVI